MTQSVSAMKTVPGGGRFPAIASACRVALLALCLAPGLAAAAPSVVPQVPTAAPVVAPTDPTDVQGWINYREANDLPALPARVVLQPPSRRLEGIADHNVDVLVLWIWRATNHVRKPTCFLQ